MVGSGGLTPENIVGLDSLPRVWVRMILQKEYATTYQRAYELGINEMILHLSLGASFLIVPSGDAFLIFECRYLTAGATVRQ